MDARAKLKAKLREKSNARRGGAPSSAGTREERLASAEQAVLSMASDDPQMLRAAHAILRDPEKWCHMVGARSK